MSYTGDSKSLDDRKVRSVDPELGVGTPKNRILDAAIALRNIGIATFFVAIIYSTLLYARRPYGEHPLPGLIDFVPGVCCQYGSTMTLTIFNKIKKKRERDVAPPSIVWRDRLCLFLGLALMTSGLVGSISILFLKQYSYFDYANVFQCVAVIISLGIVLVAKGHI